jgi:predicted alpha-1,6-mannanase (GH76 family)
MSNAENLAHDPSANRGHEQPDGSRWPERANEAARSLTRHFGARLLFLPGTHLGAVVRPSASRGNLFHPWHYWWQAHYLDCLVDAGFRELATGVRFDGGNRPSAGRLASRLVTAIRLRNFFRVTNSFYDDMAWLALATQRLQTLAEQSRRRGRGRNARIQRKLELQFDSASTSDFGGGTFWNTARDFKNTPATAPVALYYARSGRRDRAQALIDWLDARLFDAGRGLYLDGIRLREGKEVLEDGIYTYNQGPVLGALLELGGTPNLARVAVVVDAIDRHLTVPAPALGTSPCVLRCEGTGDGGLFTGILIRYIALVARDARLSEATRGTARRLVLDTAEAFWTGRLLREDPGHAVGNDGWLIFSIHAHIPAAQTYGTSAAVELSTQLQAWMALEAAATLGRP